MPIAFNTPGATPHPATAHRPLHGVADDPSMIDGFTALLLAAANAKDPATVDEPMATANAGDAAPATNDPTPAMPLCADPALPGALLVLTLPAGPAAAGLPPLQSTTVGTGDNIVGTEKRVSAMRLGTDTPSGLAAARTGTAAGTSGEPLQVSATDVPASAPAAADAHHKGLQSALDVLAGEERNARMPAAPVAATVAGGAQASSASGFAGAAAAIATGGLSRDASCVAVNANDTAVFAGAGTAHTRGGQPAVLFETIAAPAFSTAWHDETASRLAQIVLTRHERAELSLHPAELGPISIRVDMQADQANLTIVAASAETRSALEQSLPQLKDLLAGQGITLGNTTVQDGASQRDPGNRPAPTADRTGSPGAPDRQAPAQVVLLARPSNRLVDVFA